MAHALAAHDGARDFDAAFLADDALVADAAVLAAVTFVILLRAEDFLVEEAVLLRALGAVVDGFRLGDFAVLPFENAFGRRRSEAHCDIASKSVREHVLFVRGVAIQVMSLTRLSALLHEFDIERETAQRVEQAR